jgi:hypothetical protein
MVALKQLIIENFQIAQKLYINTNKLDQVAVNFLKKLSNSDYTFKTLADLYIEDQQSHIKWSDNEWKNAVVQLKNYNKNIFPIEGFSYDSANVIVTRRLLKNREEIIKILNKWPSIAKRNLKFDISIPRNENKFQRLKDVILYIDSHLNLLDNRTPETKAAIYKKIFSSNHTTFDAVANFVEDKINLLHGSAYTKQELQKLVEKNSDSLKIVYDKNNIVIVDVTSQSGIKIIGCNSIWCFTYGDEYGLAGEQWDRFSYNSHVYAIINFSESQNDPQFIHIVTKPFYTHTQPIPYYDRRQKTFDFHHNTVDDMNFDDTGIFDMANLPVHGNPYEILNDLVKNDPSALKVFTFNDM